jgi:uncharacterized membrane protein YphA (DoxX/SURF4 family)/thiol-disulfide isomerase/thioredoxin
MRALEIEKKHRNKIIWLVRIIIAFLFIISAVAKLMPIEFFEKQLVSISVKPGLLFEFTNWCTAPYWARAIIISELFLGISLLIPFFQRKLTIPLSISMLIIFICHLLLQITLYGNSGNCGCMGELIPMSPLNAIFKNIITILLLIYLYFSFKKTLNENSMFHFLLFPAILLSVFILYPIKKKCCCQEEIDTRVNKEVNILNSRIDTLISKLNSTKTSDTIVSIPLQIPKVKSIISEFHNFNEFEYNGKKIKSNIDEGKSIVCVFNPECDHCLDLAKKLKSISKNSINVKIHFLFYNPDESDIINMKKQISIFMKNSNLNVPFNLIDINSFSKLLINAPAPPRLTLLENGKIIYDYIGIERLDFKKIKQLIVN